MHDCGYLKILPNNEGMRIECCRLPRWLLPNQKLSVVYFWHLPAHIYDKILNDKTKTLD